MEQILTIALILTSGLLLWTSVAKRRRSYLPLPPGPPADPFIGHLRMIPADNNDIFFYELSKKYGKVSHLRVPGKTMILLNSAQVALDLLDKRSAIYSDREPSDVFWIMGWTQSLGFFPYGERFRRHRKMLNEYLRREKCLDYLPFQALEARRLVQNLLCEPDKFSDHLNRFSTAVILHIAYGHKVVSDDDPYLKVVSDVGDCLSKCAAPGSNLVDMVPFMKYLPSWFPGTYPATQARSFRPIVDLLHDYPFEDVKKQMMEGTAKESFISTHLEGLHREGLNYPYLVEDIKGAAGVMYAAGADSTWATLSVFFLAMVLYPSVQEKAQEEIDELLGLADRFPEFVDRPNLPYLECVLQETYRWYNATPTGIPHRLMEDDVYNGMFIPKGSVVVANTRGITLDEDVYSHPHTFDPSRYLRGEPHPIGHFGFGRRICPGRHLADSSVWIAIASILAAFNISPIRAEDGTPIMPQEEFVSGITRHVFRGQLISQQIAGLDFLLSHPKPFKCMIIPRNDKAKGVGSDPHN